MTKKHAVRSALAHTPAYVPGRPPAQAEGVESFKISSNENHLPPVDGVVEAAAAALARPGSYPEPSAAELTDELAAHLGVDPGSLILGAGGSEILASYVRITLEAGADVVYPWPSFEMYPQLAALSGGEGRPVALTEDFRHDLPAMAAAITDATRLVLLCSPNNPTGAVIRTSELDAFMAEVPDNVIVVLDEAYREFGTDPEAVDGIEALRRHPNLALMRTFSKAHGLAGLRVGYAVADPEIIGELRKVVLPFSVTDPAQAAARASLRRVSEVEVRAKEIASIRDGFAHELRALGLRVPESHGNFVWLPLGERSAEFEQACLAAGVSVRNLGSGVRVSVGPDEALRRVLEVARGFAGKDG